MITNDIVQLGLSVAGTIEGSLIDHPMRRFYSLIKINEVMVCLTNSIDKKEIIVNLSASNIDPKDMVAVEKKFKIRSKFISIEKNIDDLVILINQMIVKEKQTIHDQYVYADELKNKLTTLLKDGKTVFDALTDFEISSSHTGAGYYINGKINGLELSGILDIGNQTTISIDSLSPISLEKFKKIIEILKE